jgi:prepilin-type N-terminal cleavage/methylation domain-containing protein
VLRGSAGLTLLEVIVALAILGTGITALVQLYSSSLRTTAQAEDYSRAVLEARVLFDEAYSGPWMPEDRSVGLPGGIRAERTASAVEAADELVLYEVTVRATIPGGRIFELSGRRTLREKQ